MRQTAGLTCSEALVDRAVRLSTPRTGFFGKALPDHLRGIAALTSAVEVQVAPCAAPHFSCLPKKSKQKKAPRHPGLATLDSPRLWHPASLYLLHPCSRPTDAVPRVVSKGHAWPIVPHLAPLPNTPLHNTCARPPDGDQGAHLSACVGWKTPPAAFPAGGTLVDNAARLSTLRTAHFQHSVSGCARTESPVRKVSGSGAEGVESQGCDESWPEGRAKRVKESEAPCRAQPVARPKESAASCSAPAGQTPYSHPAQAESL